MKYKLTLALVASLTSTTFAAFQAPLPEFKNEKQLAEWRAEKATEATSQGYAAEETAFYTGKPYVASTGGYAFKYRSYSPELARWTSEDPSGFPDGPNGNTYAPIPSCELDYAGLVKVTMNFSGSSSFSKHPFKPLNPIQQGTISYEINDAKTHFTGTATGEFTDQDGKWDDSVIGTGELAIFTKGFVTQSNSGTEMIGGQTVWKKDWIEVKVTLALAVKTKSGNNLTTEKFTHQIFIQKIYGERYE